MSKDNTDSELVSTNCKYCGCEIKARKGEGTPLCDDHKEDF